MIMINKWMSTGCPDLQCKWGKWTLTAPDAVSLALYSKVVRWVTDSNSVSGDFKHHNAVDFILRLSFNNLTPALRLQQTHTHTHTHTRQKHQSTAQCNMSRVLRGNPCYLTAGDAPGDDGFGVTSHLTAQIHPTPYFLRQLNLPLRILHLRHAWRNRSSNNFISMLKLFHCVSAVWNTWCALPHPVRWYGQNRWSAGQRESVQSPHSHTVQLCRTWRPAAALCVLSRPQSHPTQTNVCKDRMVEKKL